MIKNDFEGHIHNDNCFDLDKQKYNDNDKTTMTTMCTNGIKNDNHKNFDNYIDNLCRTIQKAIAITIATLIL